jgi:diguanylate cyclase (GGDEF)-like protein
MRSPADVFVLQKPSWWTPLHAALLLTLALGVTMVVLVWVAALRRRVQQQANLLRESEMRFRHLAQHDSLTGLATRVVLQDRLDAAFASCVCNQTGLGALMLDVDKFKSINDTFGHHAGDEVLRVTANRLVETVRSTDTIVRLGGDEFLVLLADLPTPQVAETIAAGAVAALSLPILFEGVQVPVSVSVGVCTSSAEEQLDTEALLRRADDALYRAKARGRHCFHVFALDADRIPVERQEIERSSSSASASAKCA